MKKNKLILLLFSIFLLVGCVSNTPTSNSSVDGSNTSNESVPSVSTEPSTSVTPSVEPSIEPSVDPSVSVQESESSYIDYVSQLTLPRSEYEGKSFLRDGIGIVTMERHVDGDTTLFKSGNSIIMVRYNGANTPESTGRLEPWGSLASAFTKEKLEGATEIVIASEDYPNINQDSNKRYLCWVWVDGKLLNLMLVQESLATLSGLSGSKYATYFLSASTQAQTENIRIWGNEKDPDFYYGDAIPTTIKALRDNVRDGSSDDLYGKRVYFEGVVTRTLGNDAYVQATYFDEDTQTDITCGIYIFTNYRPFKIFTKGYTVGVNGVFSYYDTAGSYQIVDVYYSEYLPGKKDSVLISDVVTNVEPVTYDLSNISSTDVYVENTLIKIENVTVISGYDSNVNSSMTLTVRDSNNNTFTVRLDKSSFVYKKYYDENDELVVTNEVVSEYTWFLNQRFNFTGIVGKYNGNYQLMLLATSDYDVLK